MTLHAEATSCTYTGGVPIEKIIDISNIQSTFNTNNNNNIVDFTINSVNNDINQNIQVTCQGAQTVYPALSIGNDNYIIARISSLNKTFITSIPDISGSLSASIVNGTSLYSRFASSPLVQFNRVLSMTIQLKNNSALANNFEIDGSKLPVISVITTDAWGGLISKIITYRFTGIMKTKTLSCITPDVNVDLGSPPSWCWLFRMG